MRLSRRAPHLVSKSGGFPAGLRHQRNHKARNARICSRCPVRPLPGKICRACRQAIARRLACGTAKANRQGTVGLCCVSKSARFPAGLPAAIPNQFRARARAWRSSEKPLLEKAAFQLRGGKKIGRSGVGAPRPPAAPVLAMNSPGPARCWTKNERGGKTRRAFEPRLNYCAAASRRARAAAANRASRAAACAGLSAAHARARRARASANLCAFAAADRD